MTLRNRSRVKEPNTYNAVFYNVTVGGSSFFTVPYLTSYEYESMSDVVTPNFTERVNSGETIINPLSYQRNTRSSVGTGGVSYSGSDLSTGNVVFAYSASGPVTASFASTHNISPPSVTFDGTMRRNAVLQAYAGMDSTPLSSGEDLLELKETLGFLRSPLQGILREAKKRGISRFADVSAASWLTYRMAFMPLVRSVHDILTEIHKPTAPPADIRVSHGRAVFYKQVQESPVVPGTFIYKFSTSTVVQASVHAYVRYRVVNPKYDMRWRYGLRNKDIPASYWAVMPLSFMVDRIFDVSKMIKALTNLADPSVVILGAGITTRSETISQLQLLSVSATNSWESFSGSGEDIVTTSFSMNRGPLEPGILDIIPVIKPMGLIEDIQKTADLLALIRVFTKRN